MHFTKGKLLNNAKFKLQLETESKLIPVFKEIIKNALLQIKEHQNKGISASKIISHYTWLIDQLVVAAWRQHQQYLLEKIDVELVAVGGYGRGELHPYSDVDLLILLRENQYNDAKDFIEPLLRFLWDIGLDIGHSVRSIKDCLKEARQDVTIMTNLLEARHLSGDDALLCLLDDKLRNGRIWPADKFFIGKFDEQQTRYGKSDDSGYHLEPNLKEGIGGLRDLQTILWIFNRRYGIKTFRQMHSQEFITDDEYRVLIRARNILWKLRTGLHLAANRREDRLMFDFQRELAADFGYEDTDNQLAVEQLMKRYYRTAKDVLYLNEVLLSHYRVLNNNRLLSGSGKKIDKNFQLKHKLIEISQPDVFTKEPTAMLEMFVLMQKHHIRGIHPNTIRSIKQNLNLINTEFRSNKKSRELFISLFKHPGITLTNALARMNAYGGLGAYIPAFGAIVGQMQHDLFHVYTVDGHTLKVIEYLTRLRKYPEEYPVATQLLTSLYKPERLLVAALFHDIAKGRGGDHSVLGEADAYDFCIQHYMTEYDAKMVGWLVRNHLIMSHFSQRRDISDSSVIKEFADIVGGIEHLENLYLLTLADIRGTSPKVWNAWKSQLLLDLYHATRQAIRLGITKPHNIEEHVKDDKNAALERLQGLDINPQHIEQFWQTLPNDYFIRNDPYYIAWHIKSISQASAMSLPVVSVRFSERLEANMIFVFAPESFELLTQVTAAFDQQELNIIEARLQSTKKGFALYSFNALVPEPENATDETYMRFLESRLRELILENSEDKIISRSNASRALKHFPIKPKVTFSLDNPKYTVMDVMAQDQPGLLHNVALILKQNNIKLVTAKIATFGERAEDVFFINNQDGSPITNKITVARLIKQICSALDNNKSKIK